MAPLSTWWLEPRDPVVFGSGARVPALVPGHRFWLPPQSTAAGLVRSRFVARETEVGPGLARQLLEVRISGPWLAQKPGAGKVLGLWLPAPADVVVGKKDGGSWLLPAKFLALKSGEGTIWPEGAPPGLLLAELPARYPAPDGFKTDRLKFPFWPLERVVEWSLRPQERFLSEDEASKPVQKEYRVHVALQDDTWTAEPAALFSSSGLRFDTGFGFALEVEDGRESAAAGPAPGSPTQLLVLGAESRATLCTVSEGGCFPAFTDELRETYGARIAELAAGGQELGLRLQLLTPGCFGGWAAPWPEPLAGKLRAVVMNRFVAVSGWNLQVPPNGRPRQVRRLVAPGSLYFFGPFEADPLLALCETWWGRSLCEGFPGDLEAHLAPPAADGYGQVLPAPCALPRS
jgi:hypothetical protein